MHWTVCATVLESSLWWRTPALHLCSVWTCSPALSSCKASQTLLACQEQQPWHCASVDSNLSIQEACAQPQHGFSLSGLLSALVHEGPAAKLA